MTSSDNCTCSPEDKGMGTEILQKSVPGKGTTSATHGPQTGLYLMCFKSSKGFDEAKWRGRPVDEKSQKINKGAKLHRTL